MTNFGKKILYMGTGIILVSIKFSIFETTIRSLTNNFHLQNQMNSSGAPVLVRLGEHDQNDDNEAVHVDVSIEKLTPHDKYRQQSKYYDIGLIKLNRTIKFSAAIRPACLPDEEYPIEFATATGWGYVAYKELSSVLMKVSLKMFDHDKCSDAFPPTSHELRGIREQSQFCAGSDTGSNNTCGGDSGWMNILSAGEKPNVFLSRWTTSSSP